MHAGVPRSQCGRSPASRSSSLVSARRSRSSRPSIPSAWRAAFSACDVVSLVERAAETIKVEDAEKLAAKMAKGKFDLDDLRAQLGQIQRMGGLGALAGMMPG